MGIFSIGNAAAGLLLVLYTYNTGLLEVALQLFDCIDFPLLVQTLDHQFQVGISDQIACLLDRCEPTWDEGDTGPLRILLQELVNLLVLMLRSAIKNYPQHFPLEVVVNLFRVE